MPLTWLRLPAHLDYLQRWVLLGVVIGLVAGLFAGLFYYLINLSSSFFLGYLANYFPPSAGGEGSPVLHTGNVRWWVLVLVPAVGGLFSGLIVFRLSPEAEGHGTDAVINSFHRLGGKVRKRVPIVKMVSSVLTIGSGGSAGREGPVAQVCSGVSSWLANVLKLGDRDRRILLVCGAAAGIGSIFKSPFGGAIFAIEVLYKRDFEVDVLVPSFVASAVGYATFASFPGIGFGSIFTISGTKFTHPINLLFYIILGIVCGALAILYVKTFYGFRDHVFKRLNIPPHLKPAIGGGMLGVLALFLPATLGGGYGWIQEGIFNNLSLTFMIVLIFAKILATSFTISSGGSGGVFAPSLVIGGMIGGVLGNLLHTFVPSVSQEAFILVGMAAFFAGAAKVPIASMVMVSEMTGDYFLLAPLMIACTVSYIVSGKATIYENQVLNRAMSPAHRGEFSVDLLEEIEVQKAATRKVVTVAPDDSLLHVSGIVASTGHLVYPVVVDETLCGIISYTDILGVPHDKITSTKVKEIMQETITTCTPNETLAVALRRMDESGHGHLPVVDPNDSSKLSGILCKRDLIRGHEAYRKGIVFEHIDVLDRVKVEEVMRRDYVTIDSDTHVLSLTNLLSKNPYPAYPVLEDGKLVGTVNISKLLETFINKRDLKIREILDKRTAVSFSEESTHQALEKMHRNNLGLLPVVDIERPFKLLGILTRADLLRA
jgi:CIC family chloride channel protein